MKIVLCTFIYVLQKSIINTIIAYSGLLFLGSRQKGSFNRNMAYSILHQTSLSTPQGPWKHFLSNCPGDEETKKLATQKDVFKSQSTEYREVCTN